MNNNGKKSLKNHSSARSLSSDWNPCTDIYQTEDGWIIKVELAGIDAEDIDVSSSNHKLTVRGKRKDSFIEHEWVHLSMEILYSSFKRNIELPENADLQSVNTSYKDGMLIIKVKKTDRRKL